MKHILTSSLSLVFVVAVLPFQAYAEDPTFQTSQGVVHLNALQATLSQALGASVTETSLRGSENPAWSMEGAFPQVDDYVLNFTLEGKYVVTCAYLPLTDESGRAKIHDCSSTPAMSEEKNEALNNLPLLKASNVDN